MESLSANSVTRSPVTRSPVTRSPVTRSLVFVFFLVHFQQTRPCAEASKPVHELVKGYEAKPDVSASSFQPILSDPTGNFSLGFFRINTTRLTLAILHFSLPGPFWTADPTRYASWSAKTRIFFNGSLVISDPRSGVVWSTNTNGDRVVLREDSNLEIQKQDLDPSSSSSSSRKIVWQSFDFPTNTLVENQNFTSAMTLISSSDGLYSMKLGANFVGLYAKFEETSPQIYWKHTALQAKAEIVEGKGPVHARIHPNGYLGMYQEGNTPVDVEAFRSFQRPVNGLLILRLEPDGNLKGYYWDGSGWALNYQAISETCELPDPCGPYSLCRSGSGCSCLENRTETTRSGACIDAPRGSGGELCGGNEKEYRVLRRKGIDLPFKELMEYETVSSLSNCEALCENNCSCWGAVYNNGSGFCYLVDYPIRTMLSVGDESKVGYFKIREGAGKKEAGSGLTVGIVLFCGAVVVLVGMMGFGGYRSYRIWWMRRERGVKGVFGDEVKMSPCLYKDLGSASFRSLEMSRR